MKDLESDKLAFCNYTVKWATTIELLLENHLSELLAMRKYVGKPEFKDVWHQTDFCKDCGVSHAKELLGYSSEAITGGGCGDPELWQEMFTIADELHDFLFPLTKPEDYTPEVFDKIAQFNSRLREVRKKLEEAGIKYIARKDEKEHLT